jgi:hypothetical protein
VDRLVLPDGPDVPVDPNQWRPDPLDTAVDCRAMRSAAPGVRTGRPMTSSGQIGRWRLDAGLARR